MACGAMSRTLAEDIRGKFPVLVFIRNQSTLGSASHLVMSDSLRPHGPYSPWSSPGQNAGVGSRSLLQGSSQPRSPALQVDSLPAKPPGKPKNTGVG